MEGSGQARARGSERKVAKPVSVLTRKAASRRDKPTRTKTDTGRQGEHPQTDGRDAVKELGKIPP